MQDGMGRGKIIDIIQRKIYSFYEMENQAILYKADITRNRNFSNYRVKFEGNQ